MNSWLYRQYRSNLHRPIPPPRDRTIEAPYLWAAHLWCWITIERRKGDG